MGYYLKGGPNDPDAPQGHAVFTTVQETKYGVTPGTPGFQPLAKAGPYVPPKFTPPPKPPNVPMEDIMDMVEAHTKAAGQVPASMGDELMEHYLNPPIPEGKVNMPGINEFIQSLLQWRADFRMAVCQRHELDVAVVALSSNALVRAYGPGGPFGPAEAGELAAALQGATPEATTDNLRVHALRAAWKLETLAQILTKGFNGSHLLALKRVAFLAAMHAPGGKGQLKTPRQAVNDEE